MNGDLVWLSKDGTAPPRATGGGVCNCAAVVAALLILFILAAVLGSK
jgi:hypothetical protein